MTEPLVPWARKSHRFLSSDKHLGPIAKAVGTPKVRLRSNPFALLVQSVTGQQLSGRAAATIHGRLCELVGDVTPKRILSHAPEALRSAGLSNAKAATLHAISSAALNGLNFNKLDQLSDEDVIAQLTAIRGIGPWTAEMFLIFALGRQDVMSAGDLGLRKGLQTVYRLQEVPDVKSCEKLFERWRPYRSAACWYLWRAMEGDNSDW